MTNPFSKSEIIILDLLNSHPRRGWYGFDLVKQSDSQLSKAFIHVQLGNLIDRDFVSSELDPPTESPFPGAPARRKYFLTDIGRRTLLSQKNTAPNPSGGWAAPGPIPT